MIDRSVEVFSGGKDLDLRTPKRGSGKRGLEGSNRHCSNSQNRAPVKHEPS